MDSMKIECVHTCTSNSVAIDGKYVEFYDDLGELKMDVKNIITSLPNTAHDPDSKTVLLSILTDLVEQCDDSKHSQVKYAEKDDEQLVISILETANYRIRSLYECVTGEYITIANDDMLMEDYVTLGDIKTILCEVVDNFFNNPKHYFDDRDIRYPIMGMLSEIVENFGVCTETTGPCDCCGDYTYYFELTI